MRCVPILLAAWAALAAVACVPPPDRAAPPRAHPASPIGWYCFADCAGTMCERTLAACEDTDRDVGFHDGASCARQATASCLSYRDRDGRRHRACMSSARECAAFGARLRSSDALVVAGSITPCVITP